MCDKFLMFDLLPCIASTCICSCSRRTLDHNLTQERISTDRVNTWQYQENINIFPIVYSISISFWVPNCANPWGTVPCSSNHHLLPISANSTACHVRSSLLAEIQQISRHLGNSGKRPGHTIPPMLTAVCNHSLESPGSQGLEL